jgi:Domain of unknown function (DUF6438)
MRFSPTLATLIPLIILLLSGCSTADVRQGERYSHLVKPDEYPGDTLITIERAESFQLGPRYRLWIAGGGTVLFEGAPFGQAMRREERRIPHQQVLDLIEEFAKAGLLDLPDHFAPSHWQSFTTDAPTVVFSIKLRGVRKEVRHYTGYRGFKYEDSFYRVEALIDSIGGSKEWLVPK